jgi:hypothetical protein
MAFDSVRGVTVLYGGTDAAGLNGETWEWDGATWTRPPQSGGPPPLSCHTMVFDAAGKCCVVFGGDGALDYNNQTWAWNGSVWLQRTGTTHPAGRDVAAMAFDTSRGVAVLYGGFELDEDGETWETRSSPPTFGQQPQGATVAPGGTATFTASAPTAVAFQWRKGGRDLAESSNITGTQTQTLMITNVGPADAGQYVLVAAAPCGTALSLVAVLTVPSPCPGDFNHSGAISVQDIFDFLTAYFSNDPQADFNHSGAVSVQDIFDYLTAFFLGC